MSTVRRVTKNALLLNIARIISTLGKFFLFIYIARILGQEVLGQFSFAIVFTSFFAIIISLGMDDYLVREVARDTGTAEKYLGNMFIMRLLLSALVFCAMVIVVNILNYPPDTRLVVYIFGGYVVFTSFSFLVRANFRAFERMGWCALLETTEALFTTIIGLILIFTGFGLIPICLTFLASSIVNAIIGYIVNRKEFTRLEPEFDFQFWKSVLIKATPFAVSSLFLLYPQVDQILLASLKGADVVGKYTAAYNIVTAFSPVFMNFMIAIVPLISKYFISSKNMLGFVYEKSVKYLLIIAFPISVGAMVLAGKIVGLLYGGSYKDSILALQIIAWNCVLLAMNRPSFYLLGAINRQGTSAVITIAALVLSICLNLIIIPHFSYIGSAIITLINGILVIISSWYAVSKYGFQLSAIKLLWKPLAASAIMGLIIYAAEHMTNLDLPLLVLLGIIIYFVALIAFKGIARDDLSLFKQALHTRGSQKKAEVPQPDPGKQLSEVKN